MKLQTAVGLSAVLAAGFMSSCREADWQSFLNNPIDKSYVQLVGHIERSADHCETFRKLPIEAWQRLDQLVADGNERAYRISLLIEDCTDGGESEDVHRAMGLFLEKRPEAFLRAMARSEITDALLANRIAMLPLSLTDNLDGQIGAVENRLRLVREVVAAELLPLRDRSVAILEQRRDELAKLRERIRE